MQSSIWFSIIFLIGVIALFVGVVCWQKAEEPCSGVKWLAICIVAIMCFHTMAAGIMGVLHIPINIISIGMLDLAAGGGLLFHSKKKGKWQRYEWKGADVIFVVLLFIGIVLFALKRYTSSLSINYYSVDPAVHFQTAMYVVNTQSIYGMFHAALNNALLIELFSPAFNISSYYHIFVLGDVLNLGLAGIMFYGAIRDFCSDRFTRLIAIVLPFLYLAGYEGNSTLFGFVYLGMGVTIVAYIITIADMFLQEKINKWFNILLLCLGCYGLFECYVMFMPVVFIAVLSAILTKQIARKKLFSVETVIWGLAIFLVPCILGLYYIFSGVFTGGTTVDSAISVEGGSYRELYSNFLPYIPFAFYGLYRGIKGRMNRLVMHLLPMWMLFVGVLLELGCVGKVSSYYYFKTYYVLWLLVLWMCFYGITQISVKERALVVIYSFIQIALMANCVFEIEMRIYNKNALFNPAPKAEVYNSLLDFQIEVMKFPPYADGKTDLYKYVYDSLLEQEGTVICVSNEEDYWWYQAITNQSNNGINYYVTDLEEEFANLPDNINYVCVLYDCQGYTENQPYLDSLERVFVTDAGFIAEIAK